MLDGFADFVETMRTEWEVPGLAVTAVHRDAIVFSDGFGLRDREHDLPVTPETLFPLASVTKSFTATATAVLVDEGRIDWDTPVKTYLPDFELYDASLTERVTPRDLLSHATGVPRNDATWFNRSISRSDLMGLLRYLPPNAGLRTTYQYSNLMFMAAGYLIGAVSGSTYEDVVRTRLLEPLGMRETNFSITESKATENCSRGHSKRNDRIQSAPYYERQEAIGPAGMIVSNTAELSRWLRFHLAAGRTEDGTRLVSPEQMRELRRIQIAYRVEPSHPEEQGPSGYGLGWGIDALHGHSLVNHGGGIRGFITLAAFIPEAEAGIAILTNLDHSSAVCRTIAYNYFERCLGLEPIDWTARLREEERLDGAAGKRLAEFALAQPVSGSPAHPLTAYAGAYEHPAYGAIEVAETGAGLVVSYHGASYGLRHEHHETFRLAMDDRAAEYLVRFGTSFRGGVDSLEVAFDPFAAPIAFARVWEHARDRRLAGEFALDDGRVVRIRLRPDGALTASLPMLELQDVELVAVGPRELALASTDLLGVSVFFEEPEDDRPVERIYCRAYGGLWTATRVTAQPPATMEG
jgi:CubicO group peptidase (beta-lactamase class C family)